VDEYESELERLDRAVIQTASGLAELLVMARWSEITSRTPSSWSVASRSNSTSENGGRQSRWRCCLARR